MKKQINQTEEPADALLRLLEEETRAEVMARLGPISSSGQFYMIALQKKDEIRRMLFGTDCLTTLDEQLKITDHARSL